MGQEPTSPTTPLWARLRDALGGLGVFLTGGGVLALVLGLLLAVAIPELRNMGGILLGLGGILLLLAMFSAFPALVSTLTGRRGRYGASAVLLTILFVAIVVLLNFISFRNSARFDLTAGQHFSLAKQTIQVLEGLQDEVQVTAFYARSNPSYRALTQQAEDLLSEFGRHTSKLSFRFIDPDSRPSMARQYEVSREGILVFENLTQQNKLFRLTTPPINEQELITALLVVTGTKQKKVYFITGHGEHDSTSLIDPTGYGLARLALAADNYVVETLNLQQVSPEIGIPDDAAALIIAGPKQVLLALDLIGRVNEATILENYLRQGGQAIFLLNPDSHDTWRNLLGKWGVELSTAPLADAHSAIFGDPRTPIIRRAQYTQLLPITEPLDDTLFSQAAAVKNSIPEEDRSKEPISFFPLAITSTQSWVETDPNENVFDADEDAAGPWAVAVAIEAMAPWGEPIPEPPPTSLTTMVVFGDSDFASNQFFSSLTNGDFLLNSVNWVTKDVQLISIRSKPVQFRQLIVTSQELDFIRYSSYFLLPSLLAALAILIWWRRR